MTSREHLKDIADKTALYHSNYKPKFIRTEYGHVYEYIEQRIYPSQYLKFGLYRDSPKSEYEAVINQADTIEELCDEFVAEELFVETNYVAHINKRVSVEKNLDYFVNYFIESNKVTKDKLLNVYGAIWTDKGLIYVAKMNENGELELI